MITFVNFENENKTSYYSVQEVWDLMQKNKHTKCFGAPSTTSAGWSAPMLARQSPLHLIYFCILLTENGYISSSVENNK